MNTLRKFAHRVMPAFAFLITFLLIGAFPLRAESQAYLPPKKQDILLALLLDTSNSMDGLIDQAKSQLWRIVNELAQAKCDDGTQPNIKIALYEYGNSNLPEYEGYIRQVSGLTDDLDLVSEKLFALTTNGGSEFCGQVIKTSLDELAWSSSNTDLKMIFIAGNEPFTQGSVSYRTACSLAKGKGVVVNTIFCGAFNEGIQTDWKSGADMTAGTYMSIQQNQKTVYIPTPYDERIDALNDELNDTYVYYGKKGASKKEMQYAQDKNAESYSRSNKVERTVSKSSHAYKNSSWDMVDAAVAGDSIITSIKTEDLPEEMKRMTVEQRKSYIKTKAEGRKKIQGEIQSLNKQRQQFITQHAPAGTKDAMLDAAMINAVKQQAKTKNLSWK
jgi:hypothetical protein